MPDRRIREYAGTPPSVQPLLHALGRLEKREELSRPRLEERARALVNERFGEADAEVATGFAGSFVGLHAEHTHYFDGFAVLLPLPFGTAVAVRRAGDLPSRVAFDGLAQSLPFGNPEQAEAQAPAPWMRVFERMVVRAKTEEEAMEVAVVSTVTPACPLAYHTSLAIAAARAVDAFCGRRREPLQEAELAESVLAACTSLPFGSAYPLATAHLTKSYALVDTSTREVLPLDAPPSDEVGFALVDVREALPLPDAFFETRRSEADEGLRLLQENGFRNLHSFRALEHSQLQRALQVLPDELVPVVRYLVTENRRVYRHVATVRQADWQLMGALLLMSHAARRDDWGTSTEKIDFVVRIVEEMSAEGMHGASFVDRGSCVLVTGRPFVVPECLDRILSAFEGRYGHHPEVTLL